jgi:nicotinamide-nucleotide amidase
MMESPAHISALSEAIVKTAHDRAKKIATAESCTGGMIGAAITDIAGSSAVFDCGFITYSNDAKIEILGVPAALIEKHGAVSAEVAEAMAKGALARSHADLAVAVTGIAGPGGGTPEKPVGLVWFGIASQAGGAHAEKHVFANGGRDFVRLNAVETALEFLLQELSAAH